MNLKLVATITTTLVILGGVVLISPMFFRKANRNSPPRIAVFLYLTDDINASSWCRDVGSYLGSTNTRATVFFVGSVVDGDPSIVRSFGESVDVGSMTYDFMPLLSNPDYIAQLNNIKSGKMSVDAAGNIDSKLFASPFASVDDNIYSQLSRSGISADFSYSDYYLKFYNGSFIKMPISTIEGTSLDVKELAQAVDEPLRVIKLTSNTPAKEVIQVFDALKNAGFRFLNASDIADMQLTVR